MVIKLLKGQGIVADTLGGFGPGWSLKILGAKCVLSTILEALSAVSSRSLHLLSLRGIYYCLYFKSLQPGGVALRHNFSTASPKSPCSFQQSVGHPGLQFGRLCILESNYATHAFSQSATPLVSVTEGRIHVRARIQWGSRV